MYLNGYHLFFCVLSFYFSVCIVYSFMCPISFSLSFFVCVCVCVLSLSLSLSFFVCVCVAFIYLLVYTHAGRRPLLFCVCYYYVSIHLLCYIIVLYFVRPLAVCPLLVSQTVYRSLSLYCTKVSARVGRQLAYSLFSECVALTC